jgi:hypothetical protein
MSGSASVAASAVSSWRADPRTVRTFRYAAGSTLAMALALGVDWRLSFIAPVLTLSFLGSPAPRPTAKTAVGFLGVIALASAVGVLLSALLLPYPAVFLLLEGLMLFLLFYHGARGANPLLISMLLVALTVIPVVGLQTMLLAVAVAQGLVVGAGTAVAVVWVAHVLIPDPAASRSTSTGGTSPSNGAAKPKLPSPEAAAARAWLSTIVVFPVVLLYFVLGLTSVLILVFIALLSMQPDFSAGFKAGKALIVGNVLGGIAAIAMYELLVMMPQFSFLLLLTLLAGLVFGARLFSGVPAAPLFGMAYSTLLLVIGSTTSMFGDANAKAWTRVIQITIAVVYLVVAFGVVTRLRRRPETSHATS